MSNERRINDLSIELSDLRSQHEKDVIFLKRDRARIANKYGEVLIPRPRDSASESSESDSSSSDTESIGYGEFSVTLSIFSCGRTS